MKTTSIREELEFMFGKRELTKKELETITSLTISRMDDFGDEFYDVDLSELELFSNLNRIEFKLMVIDKGVLKAIENCNIESIYLKKCQLTENIAQLLSKMKLKSICLDNSRFKSQMIENVETDELIIIGSIISDTFSPRAKRVDISKSDVEEYILNENTEEMTISLSQYNRNKKYWDTCKKEVVVMEDNGQYEYKRLG